VCRARAITSVREARPIACRAMFRTILVGTDGTITASRAVAEAADLAAAVPGSVLHIVSVQKPMAAAAIASAEMATAAPAGAELEWEESARTALERLLADAAERAGRESLTVETHARFGAPAEVLCDMAAHLQADLLVVGNRGMQGGRRLLGSVPNTVSHHAPCSVLVVDTQAE
jgi:nucleotide-binding universal stress UspA family protein